MEGESNLEDYLMSDQQVQNVPGQAVGTAPAQVSAEGQSPTTAVQPTQEPASQTGQEAKPVTAQDLATLEDKLRREIQSKTDKSEGRIRQAVEDVKASIARLDSLGHKVSPEEAESMMSKAYDKAKLETATEPIEEPTATQLDSSQWDATDPVTRKVIELELQYGRELKSLPKEAQVSIEKGKGAVAFVKSVEAALKTASQSPAPPKQEEPKSNTNAAARIPAAGGSSGGEPAKSGRELLGRAHKED